MRCLAVAPQPFFSPRGTPMSVYYRAMIMARKGIEIDLLTYGEGQDVDVPGIRIIRIPNFSFFGRIKTGPSGLKAFLDIFIAAWMLALLIRRRYDFVHAHEEAVFIAILLRPLFRYKLVYDMHSSLPEQLRNFGWSGSRLLIRAFTWFEDTALRRADAVITICPALAEYATSRIDDLDKHLLIENSIFEPVKLAGLTDDSEQSPIEPDEIFGQMADRGVAVNVIYAGTLEHYQGIDLLLQSMVSVIGADARIGLIVAGGSPQQIAQYRDMARGLGLDDRYIFVGRVPQKTAKALCARADVLLSPRTRGMNTPLKVYEQLASGKPLVATRIPSHTQVLTDDVAFLADPEPAAFARQILRAATDTRAVAQKVSEALKLYETAYSSAVYADKIDRLLARIS